MSISEQLEGPKSTPNLPESAIFDVPLDIEFGDRGVWMLSVLWQHRRRLVRWALACFVLAILLAYLLPSRYQATTRLMPPDSGGGSEMAMAAALSGRLSGLGIGMDMLGMRSTSALIVAVLRSDRVQDHIIDEFKLREVYRTKKLEDARDELAAATEVSEDRRSGMVRVTVTDRSPKRAAEIANEYVDQLNRTLATVNTSSASREREFLESRLRDVKSQLDKNNKLLSDFSSEHGTIDVREQGKATLEAGAALKGNLIAAESELEGLRQIYTADNYRVRSASARVAELRRQSDAILGIGRGQGGESGIPSMRELPKLGLTYSDLYRDAKVQESVYEALIQKYELAKVQEMRELPTVKVLDVARPPEKRSGPKRLPIIALGLIFGFVAGAIVITVGIRWEQRSDTDPFKKIVVEIAGSTRRLAWSKAPAWIERFEHPNVATQDGQGHADR